MPFFTLILHVIPTTYFKNYLQDFASGFLESLSVWFEKLLLIKTIVRYLRFYPGKRYHFLIFL